MSGEKDLQQLLKSMKPEHHLGDYVFCKIETLENINIHEIEMFFKEKEAITLILKKEMADKWQLDYSVVMSWITLTVHSSLEAVGLTAAFRKHFQKKISVAMLWLLFITIIFLSIKKTLIWQCRF